MTSYLIVNILVAVLGLLSFFFGLIGVGVMTWFWRIMHVLIGVLLIWCAGPYILSFFRRK